MDLNFNATQTMLAESARALFSKHLPQSKLGEIETSALGYDDEIWNRMVQAGWTGLGQPDSPDGHHGDLMHLAVLMEEMGRAALASPYFQTVLAGYALGKHADQPASQSALARISAGERAAVVLPEHSRSAAKVERARDDSYMLSSEPVLVEWAEHADLLVCPAHTASGLGLFILEPDLVGLHRSSVTAFDNERLARVRLDRARVDAASWARRITIAVGEIDEFRAVMRVLRSAEMVGGGRRVLEMMVEHLSNRQQFGRPIGSFQAVQHACANVLIRLDGARLATYEALWRITHGLPYTKEAAVAAVFTGQACEFAVSTAAQLFGGVGYTREYYLHFYYRRAKAQQLRLGAPRELLEEVASTVLDARSEVARVEAR